jgi:hypothetical protein
MIYNFDIRLSAMWFTNFVEKEALFVGNQGGREYLL